jgi:hypothetical protein
MWEGAVTIHPLRMGFTDPLPEPLALPSQIIFTKILY